MAGIAGNIAQFRLGKQTAKGTPVTAFTDALFFTGGSAEPTRETDQLNETDSARHEGETFITQTGGGGSPEAYARFPSLHHVIQAATGAIATTGVGPDYVHTLTLANSLPYYTFGRSVGGVLFQQFDDCKVNELTLQADTGQPVTTTVNFMGRAATRLAADGPGALPTPSVVAPFSFNEVAVTLAGGATSLVSSFELTITNNVTVQQTDDSVPYDVVEGKREITVGFDLIFDNLTEYNKFHTGSGTGTAQTNTVYTTDLDFLFTRTALQSLQLTLSKVAYEEFPVDPDPGGDPIVVPVRARFQRSGTFTAVVKNQTAT
jgi:hypothetical protein